MSHPTFGAARLRLPSFALGFLMPAAIASALPPLAAGGGLLEGKREDILIADFEGEDYGAWTARGEAFGPGPARGTLPGQMAVTGFEGGGLANSFSGGDATTGTLTSPPFELARPYLNFLIGGGGHAGETCINLLVDGEVVRTATGPNERSGGSERLDWRSWDVSAWLGKLAVLEVIDRHTGGWGHINVDHIVLSDQPQELPAAERRRELVIRERYLHLPVQNGAPGRRMRFVVDAVTVREFDIELADGEPDWWAPADVSGFRGERLLVEVDRLARGSRGLAAILESDAFPGAEALYSERYRPAFHFTARRGWLNDPNGLVYHDGEYHLFFQHNPYGVEWGNMHWGHAVSSDLVHWREIGIALYPKRYGDWCFSGCALVDGRNSSGLADGDAGVLIAAYTSTGRGECIAYSNDRGRTWRDYNSNPVVTHRGRDPKVIWHEATRRWVMAVYDEEDGRAIAFYSSPDLRAWTFESRIGGFFECPDIFELAVGGAPGSRRWVLYGADGQYLLGDFDGKRFTPRSEKLQVWYGNFYAAQTFSDAAEGRRIQIGWGRGITFPGMPFNQQMTVPCELTLRRTAGGVRLFVQPVRELESLRAEEAVLARRTVGEEPLRVDLPPTEAFDVRAELVPKDARACGLIVRGVEVLYDAEKRTVACAGVSAPLEPEGETVRLRVLADRGSFEVFGDGGRVAISVAVVPEDAERGVEVLSRGGETVLLSLAAYRLRSAWR